jgi:hypothetical protein
MFPGDFYVFVSHTCEDICPQVFGVIFVRHGSTGIAQDKVGRSRGNVPNALLDFSFELSRHPSCMALDKQRLEWVKAVYSDFRHEFFGSPNKNAGCQLLRSLDMTETVKDSKFLREHGSSISDRGRSKGKLERQVEVGLLLGRNLEQISIQRAVMKNKEKIKWLADTIQQCIFSLSTPVDSPIDDDSGRSRLFVMVDNQDDRLMKDPSQFFVGNQDAARFNVLNGMGPSVLIDGSIRLGFDMNGELVGRYKRILIDEFGIRNAPADRVAAVNVIMIILSALGRISSRLMMLGFENGRNCSTKQVTKLAVLFELILCGRIR